MRFNNKIFSNLTVFIFLFAVQLLLQHFNGAFNSELGGYPDEAAHYVTGLMVHDYISNFRLISPAAFAEDYYIYYPKVALGHWPPFFYILQASWTSLFSSSPFSILILISLLTAVLAFSLYSFSRNRFGPIIGLGAGLIFILLPLVQKYSGMVMAEIPLSLLILWSVIIYIRFLDTKNWKWAILFSLLSLLAIMTKGNGLLLMAVPLFSAILLKRYKDHLTCKFLIPYIFIILVGLTWYLYTESMVTNGMADDFISWNFSIKAFPFYAWQFKSIFGFLLLVFIFIGFIERFLIPLFSKNLNAVWAVMGSLVFAGYLFHCLIPAGCEKRHLITIVPPLILFMGAGVSSTSGFLAGNIFKKQVTRNLISFFIFCLIVIEFFSIPGKSWHGFEAITNKILNNKEIEKIAVLVSSDSSGEGMFISDFAADSPDRPDNVILRASKVISKSRWDGRRYELILKNPTEIMSYCQQVPVKYLVLDKSMPEPRLREDQHLIEEMLKLYSNQWVLEGVYSITRAGTRFPDSLYLYRLRDCDRPLTKIQLDMSEMLGHELVKTFSEDTKRDEK